MLKGRIHSIETFGTLDGPGIRYVVFMQGCPLRCIYCHNRDTWNPSDGKEYTVDEIINELKKYIEYIRFSGGGITVTGGEPTLQAEFVTELFKRCKEMGIHTTLDTSGFADIKRVEELIRYTDLVILDIKHASPEKHKTITGVGNEKIKAFSHYLSEHGIPIWVRYVLVPGYTDSVEDLQLAAKLIRELKSVKKVEVLPYHSMGAYKWKKLGENYSLKEVNPPSSEQVAKANEILNSAVPVLK
jgi:pyruvate formate lyase activating enzyme